MEPELYFENSNINFDFNIDGIYIINKGIWQVINRKDNYTWCELFKGDCFGESEVLDIVDPTYFGDIFAKSDVDVMFISYENLKKIPYFEFDSMINTMKGKYKSVCYTITRRYTIFNLSAEISWLIVMEEIRNAESKIFSMVSSSHIQTIIDWWSAQKLDPKLQARREWPWISNKTL